MEAILAILEVILLSLTMPISPGGPAGIVEGIVQLIVGHLILFITYFYAECFGVKVFWIWTLAEFVKWSSGV